MGDPALQVTFTELDREECERLLASHQVGRLAVLAGDAPDIVPVNYATAGGGVIVFRTDPGTVLTEASLRQVAFEVDAFDAEARTGWSVVVHGFGHDIADAIDEESTRLRSLPLLTWVPGERAQWFKISPRRITGRRIAPA